MVGHRFFRCSLALLGLAMAACTNGSGEPPAAATDPYWCCDPDDVDGCTCSAYWHCTEGAEGKVCVGDDPIMPDEGSDGSWDCLYEGNVMTCTGDAGEHPDAGAGGGWDCETDNELVICSRDAGGEDTPDGGGGDWDCSYLPSQKQLICDATGGDSGSSDETGSGDDSGSSEGFLCSYGMVVFTYQGETWVMRVDKGMSTCTSTNQTSKDATFSYECNGSTYDNDGFVFNRDGDPVAPYSGDCSDLFEISNRRVGATDAGVNILYGVTHDGNLPNHFGTLCPPAGGTNELIFPDSCR